jgi:transposase
MLGVDAGFTGDRWDMLVNVFSEVVESVLADGRHKPSGELVRPKSNVAARSAEPAREVTRTITRPIRKAHFGQSTRRAPSSPHSISASLSP